ncbi:MAG: DUF349 domain-containing protein [Bacteroidales bacterium]|jgi:hypothetical protein|nr:DUF349 domain-containing protein [Bacteroidales bacterium]
MTTTSNAPEKLVEDEFNESEINDMTSHVGDDADTTVSQPVMDNNVELPLVESNDELTENFDEDELPEKEMTDYSAYERSAMVECLRQLVEKEDVDIETIRPEVDAIKFHFYKKMQAEQEAKKQNFVDVGGKEEEYMYEEDAVELLLKKYLNKYREMRNVQREASDREKLNNLTEKLKIIDELKDLSVNSESIGENFQLFRDLQNRWRAIGLVPQAEIRHIRETYHHSVEVFYDFMKINKDLRDLDFKHNLDAKTSLCEKAEALLEESSVVKAFQTLQEYHDIWHEIGPVPKEQRVEIWERFKAASSQINRKHQDYFDNLKEKRKKNLEKKETLCAKAEEIAERPLTTMSQWEKTSKELIEIQKQWNTVGAALKKENNKINKRFYSLCDKFFERKREFFSGEKAEQEKNLQAKQELCEKAEALKDRTDWKIATDEIIQLQKQWKESGNVPFKNRESIWKRFRTACDFFFEQKNKHHSSVESQYDKNLKAKQALILKIQNFAHTDNSANDLTQLKAFQQEWSEIGYVPFKQMKSIQDEYRQAINKQFDSLKMDSKERNMLLYKHKMEHLAEKPQARGKIGSERDRLVRKYQQLQSDLVVWENNIGFFSKSKNSQAMIAGVEKMIEEGRNAMNELKNKIEMIDNLEN